MLTKHTRRPYAEWMSRQVNLYEAKTQLSRLVDAAADGDIIVIAKDGKPMATLGPITGARRNSRADWDNGPTGARH
jgi:antitoxin (DNA-binding transcriptional repressor) of toxin-antitoxin stability system